MLLNKTPKFVHHLLIYVGSETGTSELLGQPRSCEDEGRVKSEEVRVDDLY